jgi:hypothetical protein
MRLPGTRNGKSGRPGRWCRIVACDLHSPPLAVELIVEAPPTRRPRTTPVTSRAAHAGANVLDELSPRQWFALPEPDRPIGEHGYARCPLHDDHVPSLKLYDLPREGWYCWTCARGGDVIEFAAWRWHRRAGRDLSAADFRELVNELRGRLCV